MRKIIATGGAPAALGPYSQGIVIGNLLFTSGQVALDPTTNKMKQDTLAEEVHQIMTNLAAIANASGTSLKDVVKATIYVTDLQNYKEINNIYGTYFTDEPPARSTVEVSKLPAGANVEIDMIVYIPNK